MGMLASSDHLLCFRTATSKKPLPPGPSDVGDHLRVSALDPHSIYFFVAAVSSALAFARFSLTPTNLASLLASLNFR